MERVFREIKDTEIRVISQKCIELKAEDGWVITEADKSLSTETSTVYLPSEQYIKEYICVNYIEPEPIPDEVEEQQADVIQ